MVPAFLCIQALLARLVRRQQYTPDGSASPRATHGRGRSLPRLEWGVRGYPWLDCTFNWGEINLEMISSR